MNPIMHKKSCHFCGMVVKSQENSSYHSVSLHFSIVKSCLWFLTTWMAFATWNTLFSHNFDVLNLMMKSDSSHFDCMVLKIQENIVHHIVFLLLCALKSDLWFSRINMDGIWNLKYTVFTQLWCAQSKYAKRFKWFWLQGSQIIGTYCFL